MSILGPSDIKTWAAAVSALAAGVVTFVSSARWETALLVCLGVGAGVLLVLVVWTRLRAVEQEVGQCRESHRVCDLRVASAHTAIAVLHTRLARHDASLPRLTDLLGADATGALLRASEADSATADK
ncbi:MAG: hypothetical protein ACPHN2_04775 [Sinimarinibacterium flocculans]|jgi:membrane protein implicated in regulation of membrane protease activity|uniref:hypothetical protein n=1 Tax=Sinimarinibacterium flocculans TaxID=985250 RepID=UPI000E854509|nr:hypothetical protein [Gammaproteobacteria bacterium]MCH78748.1 hypothetical protein [Gammaproteobacteria bacterium]